MGNKYLATTVSTWDEAIDLGKKLGTNWVFRGQADKIWELKTSFERNAFDLKSNLDEITLKDCEDWIINKFRRRAHNYLNNLPPVHDLFEWLVLIQHHGGPTRLLDFTHSFYIGAFFATASAISDSAIWAVNTRSLKKNIQESLNYKPENENDLTIHLILEINNRVIKDKIVIPCLNDSLKDTIDTNIGLVVFIEPFFLNQRISVQQGLFLFPIWLSGFKQNLEISLMCPEKGIETKANEITKDDIDESAMIKIILPRGIHSEALFDLEKMNITEESLFPGLDGFARSMKIVLRSSDYRQQIFIREITGNK